MHDAFVAGSSLALGTRAFLASQQYSMMPFCDSFRRASVKLQGPYFPYTNFGDTNITSSVGTELTAMRNGYLVL